MKTKIYKLATFLKDEEGLTTVEYAVAGTLISLAIVAAFTNLSTAVSGSINRITSLIQ